MYLSLARKYRPKHFDEVRGEGHIVLTLKNAIKLNRINHAYLFFGPRGTGKTSVARILAKSLNCKEGPREICCCKCQSCLEIDESRSLDVIEIDGASNRGIDQIRELRESVGYRAIGGRYKVYIIDEVHMLTIEAFNALDAVISKDEIKEGIEIVHRFGIRIHGMFVLGSDSDREETMKETVDFAKKYKIDTVQFLILTPLPGTKTFDELDKKGRIFTYDWSLYDGMNVVYQPKHMTPYQLQLGNIKALRRFYSLRSVIKLLLKFKFLNALLRYYGRRLRKRWEAKHKKALEKLKLFSSGAFEKKK